MKQMSLTLSIPEMLQVLVPDAPRAETTTCFAIRQDCSANAHDLKKLAAKNHPRDPSRLKNSFVEVN